ncbi:FMN-binding negative transcriptional regulator [Streptomyces sp. NPDC087300]|uniref:FMN-binding negative transcriptional regulator n=1 Tax=Streptomyces sp. NPDC087300 TaxID=3365780 RepID=UPI00381B8DB3
MFVPSDYRQADPAWAAELIRRNPLALLATNGPESREPFATHLPVIPDPEMPADWYEKDLQFAGATLLGHMNRANPHWKALAAASAGTEGVRALLTFTGPHAYVSPTVYAKPVAAPTWNFTAVHVHGVLRGIEPGEATLAVVQHTVRAFEREFGADWDMTTSVDYFRQIVPGVGAFRFHVTAVEGMFKLSQEQAPEVRERVRREFASRDSHLHRETAHLMERWEEEVVAPSQASQASQPSRPAPTHAPSPAPVPSPVQGCPVAHAAR